MRHFIGAIGAACGFMFLATPVLAQQAPGTIAAFGVESMHVRASSIRLATLIHAEGKTAKEALASLHAQRESTIAKLKTLGADPASIHCEAFSVGIVPEVSGVPMPSYSAPGIYPAPSSYSPSTSNDLTPVPSAGPMPTLAPTSSWSPPASGPSTYVPGPATAPTPTPLPNTTEPTPAMPAATYPAPTVIAPTVIAPTVPSARVPALPATVDRKPELPSATNPAVTIPTVVSAFPGAPALVTAPASSSSQQYCAKVSVSAKWPIRTDDSDKIALAAESLRERLVAADVISDAPASPVAYTMPPTVYATTSAPIYLPATRFVSGSSVPPPAVVSVEPFNPFSCIFSRASIAVS